jgi:TM2 domain-containing membrane protein YozV
MTKENKKKGLSKKEFRQQRLYDLKKKNPLVAVGLSLIVVGTGSMYAGKVLSGILQLIICLMLWIFFLGWIVWIISPILAYFDVKEKNEMLLYELDLDE